MNKLFYNILFYNIDKTMLNSKFFCNSVTLPKSKKIFLNDRLKTYTVLCKLFTMLP